MRLTDPDKRLANGRYTIPVNAAPSIGKSIAVTVTDERDYNEPVTGERPEKFPTSPVTPDMTRAYNLARDLLWPRGKR